MRDTVGFIHTGAGRTGPGRIARVNQQNRDAGSFGFVADQLSQLVERPVAVPASLRATNRSLADTAQIFESDCPASVLRLLDKPLADRVIGMLLKTCLLPGQLLEFASGRPGLFLLESATAMLKNAPISLNVCPAEIPAIRIGGEIDNPQIHPENSLHLHRPGCFYVTGNEQIKLPFDVTQVTLPALTPQHFQLPRPGREADPLTTVYRPDRDFLPFQMVRKNAAVKGNRSMGLEPAPGFAVHLVSICHFGDATHNDLRRQLKQAPCVSVGQFVQSELAKGFVVPRLITDVVADSIRPFKRFAQCIRLFRRRKEFDLRSQFHNRIVPAFQSISKATSTAKAARL